MIISYFLKKFEYLYTLPLCNAFEYSEIYVTLMLLLF